MTAVLVCHRKEKVGWFSGHDSSPWALQSRSGSSRDGEFADKNRDSVRRVAVRLIERERRCKRTTFICTYALFFQLGNSETNMQKGLT